MADIATLAIKVENSDVPRATASLDALTVAGGKSEAAAQRLTRRMALLEIEARGMDASMGKAESRAMSMGKAWAAAGAALGAAFVFREIIKNTEEAQNAMAQLEAAVKSTGGVAGRSVAQLDAFSMALQQTTVYSDEAVKGAQAMLLTFDRIRGTQFDQATQAVADLAARMGGDLQGAAVQVGKALQDPETGLTALRRSGVSFTAAQIQMIKTMYETNRVAEGQAIILKELEHQFGGSAAGARDTLGGALTHLKNVFGDLFEVSKTGSASVVAAINAIADALPKAGAAMGQFVTNTITGYNNISAAIQKGLNWVKAFADLSHGNGASLASIGVLNRAIEEERLGANALALTTTAATTATIAHTKATYESADADRKAAAAAKELEAERRRVANINNRNADVDTAFEIAHNLKKQDDAAKALTTTLAGVAAAWERIRAAQAGREAVKAQEDADAAKQAKYVQDIRNIWRDGAGKIAGDFVKSMSRGFEEVYNLAVKLMKRMEEANKASGFGYNALKYGSAAIGGGLAGYAVGQATGNRVTGALGGAGAGALAGSAYGPIGTAVGAVAGFVGGIIGAGNAAKEAAKQMAELQKALAANIASIKAQLSGDSLGAAIAQEKARFDALRKQTEDAYSGGGAGSEQVRKRNAVLAELNGLEAQRIQQLRDEAALTLKRLNEDVQVQILRNNGDADAADAVAKAIDQERRFIELRKAGIDDALLAQLKESEAKRDADAAALAAANAIKEAADAAAAAAQEAADKARAQAQAVEDINVELLNAKGQTGAAGDLQFQLEQQRRLDEAKKEQSDEYVAKLIELQQIQRDQRAVAGLIDETRGPSSAARAATIAVNAVSATVTDRTALVLVDLTRAQNTTLEKIEANTRSGGAGGNGGRIDVRIRTELAPQDRDRLVEEFARAVDEIVGGKTTIAQIFAGAVGR